MYDVEIGNSISRQKALSALIDYPYFLFNSYIRKNRNNIRGELIEIASYYNDYEKGAEFSVDSDGDTVPTQMHFKEISTLIDKQARFMFSNPPDVNISESNEGDKSVVDSYRSILDKVFEKSELDVRLLQAAKDCLIGKRVAMLVDYSERDGAVVRFYDSLHFLYETEEETNRVSKFVCFETFYDEENQRRFAISLYEDEDGSIYVTQEIYNGAGIVLETLIDRKEIIGLDEIPAVIVTNSGTLSKKRGVSEVKSLSESESVYNKLGSGDVDAERKNMNPIYYVIDMNRKTTEGMGLYPGALWELEHSQTVNEPKPMIGVLSPTLNHSEPLKTTMERIKTSMYSSVDVPDITAETLSGTITSGKGIRALYFPLSVRCNEKMLVWRPSLEKVVKTIIKMVVLNSAISKELYYVPNVEAVQFKVEVVENYALLDDENEEKAVDLDEISAKVRSRFSYIKKWRGSEFKGDEEIEEEILRIAMEENILDAVQPTPYIERKTEQKNVVSQVDDLIND